jgi:hypothetical protein
MLGNLTKIKIHTTNYTSTFIEVAADCTVAVGEIPPAKENIKSVANIQYDILSKNPYKYTSDDILFQVFAERTTWIKMSFKKQENIFSQMVNLAFVHHLWQKDMVGEFTAMKKGKLPFMQ